MASFNARYYQLYQRVKNGDIQEMPDDLRTRLIDFMAHNKPLMGGVNAARDRLNFFAANPQLWSYIGYDAARGVQYWKQNNDWLNYSQRRYTTIMELLANPGEGADPGFLERARQEAVQLQKDIKSAESNL